MNPKLSSVCFNIFLFIFFFSYVINIYRRTPYMAVQISFSMRNFPLDLWHFGTEELLCETGLDVYYVWICQIKQNQDVCMEYFYNKSIDRRIAHNPQFLNIFKCVCTH